MDLYSNNIEIINKKSNNISFKAALFDFDGTLSLIRNGWQDIMIPYFCEEFFTSVPNSNEEQKDITALVKNFVDELTGKQTIYQCIQLKDEIEKRGGKAKTPQEYKKEYLNRLMLKIENIRNGLANKSISPDSYLVKGAKEFLSLLKNKEIDLYLASGTDFSQVEEEAKLLGLQDYFGKNIFGATDENMHLCAKEVVIKNLIEKQKIKGNELLGIGDGFVEIELINKLNGYTIAVAADEKTHTAVDTTKRTRLITAGADIVLVDFSNIETLSEFIFS